MRPLKLKLVAFEPYINSVELDFEKYLKNKNIFLIYGETGSGKTSLLDAICFALYGDSAGGFRTPKMLRSNGADPTRETIVDLTFALVRKPAQSIAKKRGTGLKDSPAAAELFIIDEDGSESCIETRPDFVTKKIVDLIGFKCDQFRQVVLLPQGQFQRFLTANSHERQDILKILFKTDFYENLESELKNRATTKLAQLNDCNSRIQNILEDTCTNSELELKNHIESLSIKLNDSIKMSNQLMKLRNDANQRLSDAKLLDSLFMDLDNKSAQLIEANSALESSQSLFNSAKIEYLNRKAEESKRLNLSKDIDNFKSIQRQINELNLVKNKLHDAINQSKQAEEDFIKANDDADTCEKLLKKLKENEKTLSKQAAKLPAAQIQADNCQLRDSLIKRQNQLKSQIVDVQSKCKIFDKKESEQRIKVDQLNKLWHQGCAAQLAQSLSEGSPCPVCGSVHHPNLANLTVHIPSDADLQTAQDNLNKIISSKQTANINLAELNTSLEHIKDQISNINAITTADAISELNAAKVAASDLEHCQYRISIGEPKTENAKRDLDIKRKIKEDKSKVAAIIQGSFNNQSNLIHNALIPYNLNIDQLSNALFDAEKSLNSLNSAWINAESKFNELSNRLMSDKKTAQIKLEDVSNLQKILADKSKPNISKLHEDFITADLNLNQNNDTIAELKAEINSKRNRLNQLSELNKTLTKLENEYSVLANLADVACGKRPQGPLNAKISFSRFALQSKLNAVIKAANIRLNLMSNGNYQLRHKSNANNKASYAGLELEIYDAFNSSARPVETLSGGESFLASLALALGLADTVQSQFGGIKLDTIFIDEGFGSLDSDKLKNTINALLLQTDGRLVGIISHVDYLINRIPDALHVIKSDTGSNAHFVSNHFLI